MKMTSLVNVQVRICVGSNFHGKIYMVKIFILGIFQQTHKIFGWIFIWFKIWKAPPQYQIYFRDQQQLCFDKKHPISNGWQYEMYIFHEWIILFFFSENSKTRLKLNFNQQFSAYLLTNHFQCIFPVHFILYGKFTIFTSFLTEFGIFRNCGFAITWNVH